jgi:hypothetical protein
MPESMQGAGSLAAAAEAEGEGEEEVGVEDDAMGEETAVAELSDDDDVVPGDELLAGPEPPDFDDLVARSLLGCGEGSAQGLTLTRKARRQVRVTDAPLWRLRARTWRPRSLCKLAWTGTVGLG